METQYLEVSVVSRFKEERIALERQEAGLLLAVNVAVWGVTSLLALGWIH